MNSAVADQYLANYSMAGRLIQPEEGPDDGGDLIALDFLRWDLKQRPKPPPLSRGYLRWGRHEGCAFVTGSARQWPARYLCGKDDEYGCSADNRMASVCSLRSGITVPKVCVGGGGWRGGQGLRGLQAGQPWTGVGGGVRGARGGGGPRRQGLSGGSVRRTCP
jgi:hypothetical protein